MDFHPVVPLAALLGLVHLRIPLPLFVLGGAGRCNQGGIHDRALAHRHAPSAEMGIDRLKDLLAQLVLLKQVPEGQDRGLVLDSVTDQIDAGKAAHGGHLDQGILHRWITEGVPLLQQVDQQHRGQRVRRTPIFLAGLGVVGLDQGDEGLQGHDHLHLSQELLAIGLLLGGRLLVVREAELLAAYQPSPACDH